MKTSRHHDPEWRAALHARLDAILDARAELEEEAGISHEEDNALLGPRSYAYLSTTPVGPKARELLTAAAAVAGDAVGTRLRCAALQSPAEDAAQMRQVLREWLLTLGPILKLPLPSILSGEVHDCLADIRSGSGCGPWMWGRFGQSLRRASEAIDQRTCTALALRAWRRSSGSDALSLSAKVREKPIDTSPLPLGSSGIRSGNGRLRVAQLLENFLSRLRFNGLTRANSGNRSALGFSDWAVAGPRAFNWRATITARRSAEPRS
jgi:hypothetical protein